MGPGLRVSLTESNTIVDLTDVTLVDEDTNSILPDMLIGQSKAMCQCKNTQSGDQLCN